MPSCNRVVNKIGKFLHPIQSLGSAVHFIKGTGGSGFGTSKRRTVKIRYIPFTDSFSQRPGFAPSLFR